MRISSHCPKIHTFLLEDPRETITSAGLLNFLTSTPSISNFCSWSGLENAINERVWLHFAARPSLQRFSLLSNLLTQELSSRIRQIVAQPFPSLTSLECRPESAAIGPLLSYLSGLRGLKLSLSNASTDMFSTIAAKCPFLQYLVIDEYGPNSRCDGGGLFAIAERCKALQILEINQSAWGNGPADMRVKFNDSDVERFTKALPGLRICHLDIQSELTEASLRTFGLNRRTLETLMVRGSFTIQGLSIDAECLFPKLKDANFLECGDYGQESIDEIKRVMRFHTPLLERLDSGTEQSGMDKWVALAWSIPE